jgi:hypothetical protein
MDGIEAGAMEALGNEQTRQWKARLGADPALLYPQLADVH